jgi:hypothetical protein
LIALPSRPSVVEAMLVSLRCGRRSDRCEGEIVGVRRKEGFDGIFLLFVLVVVFIRFDPASVTRSRVVTNRSLFGGLKGSQDRKGL